MKVTQWFKEKPVHVGVYQCESTGEGAPRMFRYWNGVHFGGFGRTPEESDTPRIRNIRSAYQDDKWRGLAVRPMIENEWILWGGGGSPPVPDNAIVDLKFRAGQLRLAEENIGYYWGHRENGGDIIAYRLHGLNEQASDAA